jgi:hypothetical protein
MPACDALHPRDGIPEDDCITPTNACPPCRGLPNAVTVAIPANANANSDANGDADSIARCLG